MRNENTFTLLPRKIYSHTDSMEIQDSDRQDIKCDYLIDYMGIIVK